MKVISKQEFLELIESSDTANYYVVDDYFLTKAKMNDENGQIVECMLLQVVLKRKPNERKN